MKKFCYLVLLVTIFASTLSGQEKTLYISISAGWFDFLQQDNDAFEVRYEFRVNEGIWEVKPFMGFMGTSDGAVHIFAGLWCDIFLFNNKIAITPSFSPCIFSDGKKGKALRNVTEFRSQIEISYLFENKSRLGINVNHISNAGLNPYNPGVESIGLNYSIPIN